ncbi:NAD(P)H-binding protein [Oryzicola mucosus]|uniref:NAD(P)H-binding protein n=1 Tax=Oryzicola mucosus TaxID=2767425 RepID=A0A8J6PXZ9_9HYPH|nr:NAD(P)H-binding protein [Oryzicola mucosus]MBD0416267.1 NAD(P)H-binding protein [Oryzicola mucosus]
MEQNKTALVLGATGGIGSSIATALVRHGWHVSGMVRDTAKAQNQGPAQVHWVAGDAMERDDVIRAVAGATIVVHAVNPPNYMNWDKLVLPMIDNTIAAAKSAGGARIVLPGTIYNFDPKATPVISADSAQHPNSRKGQIRVALEQRLEQAAPEVPSLILRAGDFFGPGARASWFAQAMVSPGKPVRRIVDPARGSGHSWAYLPDLAEAFAQLVDNPTRLGRFERLQFEGYVDDSGKTMVEAIRNACGSRLRSYGFPWWLMRLAAPFASFPREAAELAPYWRYPVRLDNSRLVELIGREPRTPLNEAVKTSLIEMGCLPKPAMQLTGPVLA